VLNAVAYDPVSGNWIAVGGDFFHSAAFYSNDGISWQSASGLSGGPLYSLAVDSVGTAVVVGDGVILRSVDGGATYTAVSNAPTEALKSVVAVADGLFIAAGFNGLIVEVAGNSATILRDSVAGALTIDAVITIDGAALLSGEAVVPVSSIDPDGGVFSIPVTVTLSVPVGTQVYYTIDGSLPSDQSTSYVESFVLENSTTVRVVAVDGAISSAVTSATFVLTALPNLQISVLDSTYFSIELPDSQTTLSYQLQTSVNLANWDLLQSLRTGSGGELTWTVPINGTHLFYRVLISD
jgi:hypothetical protein